ncbi:large ribosomal subunit protein P1-like [Myotis yumanensis]|uniref:large ribosomal subunit protein P1-like n=1 Tax=Myotis yumanensis TaxID=159337 RepID=UPI0038D22147
MSTLPRSTCLPLAHTVSSVWELACIYSALILHDDEITVTALANVNIGSFCNVRPSGPAGAGTRDPAPSTTATSAEEKKVEAKKESWESGDDKCFGLFEPLL